MPIIHEAHDFVISGGDFRSVQNYQYGPTGIDVLREASTPEAAVDAEERSYAPSCYPGTRKQYIDDITKWAAAWNGSDAQPIYWMKGPAGVGKSAIAQTCASTLRDADQLGAAFFFSINGRRKDHTRFFPSLAYQLSTISDDYREIVNRKVSADQTVVKKTMTSQFRSLIVEPLRDLKEQGKELRRGAIFIDGLDECESRNAQVEIIKIIALSVQNGSTPFRWAIFSREEPHISSTFADPTVSSHCYSVFLPVSRKADEEIELYLRGGFRNILQRRDLINISSSWPTAEDIKKLVDAAAGLFAHSATVLSFIDHNSYSGFKESLEAVLACIANPGAKPMALHSELDKLYTLILQRVPGDILPTALLLFSNLARDYYMSGNWYIAVICNFLGITEDVFRSIYHHLQAVLTIWDPPQLRIDQATLERSFFDQDSTVEFSDSLEDQLLEVHGTTSFHHKSFYDFIVDPTRSSNFCVTTSVARQNLFDRYVQQHIHYSSSLAIQGLSMTFPYCINTRAYCGILELVLAPGVSTSSSLLSWPKGSELVDSALQLRSLRDISWRLVHGDRNFGTFLRDVSSSSLHQLTELDHRKYLIADRLINGPGLHAGYDVIGYSEAGTSRYTDDSVFTCIDKDKYDVFDAVVFLRMVDKLETAGIIRPYDPRFGASRVTSLLHTLSRQKSYSRRHGQYKLGHGDKSVIWYWEFDTEKRYFHEFRTMNFVQAMAYYKAYKFKIWERTNADYVTDSDQEDDTGDEGEVMGEEYGGETIKDEDDKHGETRSRGIAQLATRKVVARLVGRSF